MMWARTSLLLAALAVLAAAPLPLGASNSGPIPAVTGGFGEMSCHQCHWDNDLNQPEGSLVLSGIPDHYAPGQRYSITVSVAHPGLVKAGFQLSARLAAGTNAGTLTPADELVQAVVDETTSVTYLQHTTAGTVVTSGSEARWTVEWTAPEAGGVTFHVAANAADGDASPLGDFVFTASADSSPE